LKRQRRKTKMRMSNKKMNCGALFRQSVNLIQSLVLIGVAASYS